MAKNKPDENKKDSKKSEKLKKEKKSLKKTMKALNKREKELDKREKRLEKKEKQLHKREVELFDIINNQQYEEKEDPILDAAEQTASPNQSDHLPKKEPLKSPTKPNVTFVDTSIEKGGNSAKRTRIKPAQNKTNADAQDTSSEKSSNDYTVRQGFALIRKMDSEQKVRKFLEGDERKTMQDAGERRIKQLNT